MWLILRTTFGACWKYKFPGDSDWVAGERIQKSAFSSNVLVGSDAAFQGLSFEGVTFQTGRSWFQRSRIVGFHWLAVPTWFWPVIALGLRGLIWEMNHKQFFWAGQKHGKRYAFERRRWWFCVGRLRLVRRNSPQCRKTCNEGWWEGRQRGARGEKWMGVSGLGDWLDMEREAGEGEQVAPGFHTWETRPIEASFLEIRESGKTDGWNTQ